MLHVLYIIAITAESITAALAAGRRGMDWVGVLIIAWVTALGGGTIRNILLGHYPMSWIEHPEYLLITAGGVAFAGLLAKFMRKLKILFLYLDAVGLVVFTIIGCKLAESMQLPEIIIVMSGVITGCAGGVLRDVLCNDIPLLFRKEIYASASVVTGALYLIIQYLGVTMEAAVIVSCILGLALRLLSIKFEWQMPRFVYHDDVGTGSGL